MSYGLERSPSNRAMCNGDCGKSIEKGKARIVYESFVGSYKSLDFYCQKCGKERLQKEIKDLKKLMFKLKHFDELEVEGEI